MHYCNESYSCVYAIHILIFGPVGKDLGSKIQLKCLARPGSIARTHF